MIHIIYKMLVSLKNNLNYLKDSTLECFFKEYNRLFYNFFFIKYNPDNPERKPRQKKKWNT